jgi:hypothetical protein
MDKKSMIYMTLNFLYSIFMVIIDTKLYNRNGMVVGHNTINWNDYTMPSKAGYPDGYHRQ